MSGGLELVALPDKDDGRGATHFVDAATLAWLEGGVRDIHLVAIAPGKVRGNHRHRARREVVLVRYDGAVEVAWRAADGETRRERFEGRGAFLARIEPGVLHAFRNAGIGAVDVVSISNGTFAPDETEYVTLLP